MSEDATKQCPFCIGEVPQLATRCRHCAADFESVSNHTDLGGLFVAGILIGLVGAAIMAAGGDGFAWGLIVVSIGGLLLEIGVIAAGVSIGNRNSDDQTRRQRYQKAQLDDSTA